MTQIDCVQGTDEWRSARCGVPTASGFDKIITMDGKQSKQREKYLYQLAGERIIGKTEETYQNGAMQRGIEMEAEARQLYELITGETVEQVGLCLDSGSGASPDGLVGKNGGLEIKCPILSTHVSYLLKNELPSEYFQQVQGNLFITGRKWWDFLSYSPGLKPLIIRVFPDKKFQEDLKVALELFNKELEEIVAKIR